MTSISPPHIVIIGSGISGLAAAKELFDHSCQLTILEARNRIGGRVYTYYSAGIPIDLGASWIHGFDKTNPLTKLVEQAHLRTRSFEKLVLFDRPEELPVNNDEKSQLLDKLYEIMDNAMEFAKKNRDKIPKEKSLKDFIDNCLTGLDKKIWPPERLSRLNRMTQFMENDNAVDLDKLSLKYIDTEITFPGEQCYLIDGYDKLIESYASEVIRSGIIKLGETVKEICYNETSVTIKTTSTTYHASAVICTLPLGVLKTTLGPNPSLTFIPPLPNLTSSSIHNLGVGVLDKCILTFKENIQTPWDSTADFIVCLPADEHTVSTSILSSSLLSYLNIAPMHPSNSFQTLVAYYSQRTARAIEALPREDLPSLFITHLQRYFPTIHLNDLLKVEVTAWDVDPFSRGSYTHIPISGSPADLDQFLRPLKGGPTGAVDLDPESSEGVIFFAGEHTTRYFASMHGALISGEREGKKVVKRFKLERRAAE